MINKSKLATRIIPCLDVDQGRVVKGVQFIDIRDAGDPVEAAIRYDQAGADEICFLDISASHESRDTLLETVEQIARHIFIPLTVGGGVKSVADIRRLLNAGADKVAMNTAAVREPALVQQASEVFGAQCIVVALDAKEVSPGHWEIFTHGGRQKTGINAVLFAQQVAAFGAGEILLTSMDRDGSKIGFDLALTKAVTQAVTIPVIASGGVGHLQHLVDGVILGGADAVLAASIFHFGEYTIAQAKSALAQNGVIVRDDFNNSSLDV